MVASLSFLSPSNAFGQTFLSPRTEQLEDDVKASQEKIEQLTSGWSAVNQKMTVQELQKALNSQEQLCVAIIEDKKKLINDLQQVTPSS